METESQNNQEHPQISEDTTDISEFAGYTNTVSESTPQPPPDKPPFLSLSSKDLDATDNKPLLKTHFFTRIFNRHHRKPILLGFVGGVVVFFSFTTFSFFASHALPNSYLGSQDISFWSRDKILAHASEQINNYSIYLEKESAKTPVLLSEIGVSLDKDSTVSNVFSAQNSFFEKLQLWKKRHHSYQSSLDEQKVLAFADAQKTTLSTASQNAAISIEDGQVVIIPEVNADEWVLKEPLNSLKTSLQSSESITLTLERATTPPEVTSAKLEPLQAHIQTLIQTPLTLTINSQSISTSADQRASWLTIDAGSTDTTAAHFDPVKIEGYVDGVTRPYIKPPRSRVVVSASDGSTKELVAGEDGVSVTNISSVASKIIQALESKKPAIIDIPVAFAQRSTITAADYPKWLQADLTNKRIYAYEHGNLIKEYAMSAGAPDTPTVVGEYKILYKVRKQTMRGLNSDGTRYTQPDVEWVNYFYQDYAIHGNYWRPASVFGNVNTSHGCVGLPNVNAEWIYNWAPVGTPVITHY